MADLAHKKGDTWMKSRTAITLAVAGIGLALSATPALADSVGTATPVDCQQQDLAAYASAQGLSGGYNRALLNVRNVSDHDCVIGGRAAIRLVNAAYGTADVPTRGVAQPGDGTRFTLKPGGGGFQGIKWLPCDKGLPDCFAGNSLQWKYSTSLDNDIDLTPERESEGEASGYRVVTSGFPAPERSAITMSWLQIGTLQPSNQGVVAW
jgi:hypothetical protein